MFRVRVRVGFELAFELGLRLGVICVRLILVSRTLFGLWLGLGLRWAPKKNSNAHSDLALGQTR